MTFKLYPLSNYTFSVKDVQHEEDPSVNSRLQRLQRDFEQTGMRTTVEAVMLCHEHGHPHLLVLQVANSFFKLPGEYLRPGETQENALQTHLEYRLGVPTSAWDSDDGSSDGGGVTSSKSDWQVAELLANWWRPGFESFMYPYHPPHVTDPKELKSVHLIQLPKKKVLAVPKNMKLVAM